MDASAPDTVSQSTMSLSHRLISTTELHRLFSANADLTLIDVRTPAEFSKIHVPRARNEPLNRLHPHELIETGSVSRTQPVYIICETEGRAKKAAWKFAEAGHKEAYVVEGGTQAWIKANLPVARGEIKVISLERQVRIAAGSLVVTGVALGWFVHRGFYGVAGFVGAGLVFAGITDFCGLGLLLARLPWNQRNH